jgi:hypothetical protein
MFYDIGFFIGFLNAKKESEQKTPKPFALSLAIKEYTKNEKKLPSV